MGFIKLGQRQHQGAKCQQDGRNCEVRRMVKRKNFCKILIDQLKRPFQIVLDGISLHSFSQTTIYRKELETNWERIDKLKLALTREG